MEQAKYTSSGKGIKQHSWSEEGMKKFMPGAIKSTLKGKKGEDLEQEMMIYF